jgi:hypothetical protein
MHLAGWRFRQSINGQSPYLQVVHKPSVAFGPHTDERGVCSVAKPPSTVLRPKFKVSSLLLNLKSFGLCSTLK